jgi:hypothetical protein
MNRSDRPSSPRPTTEKPITAPPENATSSALLRLVRAAAAVRTLAAVATRMPMNPASAEQPAPAISDTPISQELPAAARLAKASRAATTSTKIASTRYSRPRNAIAPSRMWLAISFISALPSSWRLIQALRTKAKMSARAPATGSR